MLAALGIGPVLTENPRREGDLFKMIRLYGRTFEIRYGFYEERDRHTRYAEPVAIYPDFRAQPQHTEDGTPFVTAMQPSCPSFHGKQSMDSACGDCGYYCHGDELLGTCVCPGKKHITAR